MRPPPVDGAQGGAQGDVSAVGDTKGAQGSGPSGGQPPGGETGGATAESLVLSLFENAEAEESEQSSSLLSFQADLAEDGYSTALAALAA